MLRLVSSSWFESLCKLTLYAPGDIFSEHLWRCLFQQTGKLMNLGACTDFPACFALLALNDTLKPPS